jgi:hypothetical protein
LALFDNKTQKQADSLIRLDNEFSRAITKGFFEELKSFSTKKTSRLLPLDDVKKKLGLWFATDMGIKSVLLDSIIGSQGRYRSFTRHFFPLDESLRNRWKNVGKVILSKKDIPPVELYKICDAYFVKDGHHRISVARSQNRKYINAKVFEYDCDLGLDKDTDIEKLTILETYHKFLQETDLQKQRNPDLELTRLGGYSILMKHILSHQHYLKIKHDKEDISIQTAAVSWYDRVYLPFNQIIKTSKIMKHFPHRTTTDFYIWIIQSRDKLTSEVIKAFDKDEAENLVAEYAKKFATPFRKVIGKIRDILGIVRY